MLTFLSRIFYPRTPPGHPWVSKEELTRREPTLIVLSIFCSSPKALGSRDNFPGVSHCFNTHPYIRPWYIEKQKKMASPLILKIKMQFDKKTGKHAKICKLNYTYSARVSGFYFVPNSLRSQHSALHSVVGSFNLRHVHKP